MNSSTGAWFHIKIPGFWGANTWGDYGDHDNILNKISKIHGDHDDILNISNLKNTCIAEHSNYNYLREMKGADATYDIRDSDLYIRLKISILDHASM